MGSVWQAEIECLGKSKANFFKENFEVIELCVFKESWKLCPAPSQYKINEWKIY